MESDKFKVKALIVIICSLVIVLGGIFVYKKCTDNEQPQQLISYEMKAIEEFNLENINEYAYLIYYNTLNKVYYLGRFKSMSGKYGVVLETEYHLGKTPANFGEYKDGTIEILFENEKIIFGEKGIISQIEEKNEIATFGILEDYIYDVAMDDPIVQLSSIKKDSISVENINLNNMDYTIPIDLLSPNTIEQFREIKTTD